MQKIILNGRDCYGNIRWFFNDGVLWNMKNRKAKSMGSTDALLFIWSDKLVTLVDRQLGCHYENVMSR